jgi:hypothetical protein
MIPKVVVLKTGERVVAGLAEVIDNETNKAVCLLLRCPYILTLRPKDESGDFEVNFTKWIPFSSDKQFRVSYDALVAIGEVEESILNAYMEKFGQELVEDERGNDGSGDDGDSAESGDDGESDSDNSSEE